MKRNIFSLFILLMTVIIVAACGNSGKESNGSKDTASKNESEDNKSNDGEIFELNFTHVQPKEHPTNVAAEWAAEELDKKTDGRVQLKVYPGGALGGPDENVAGMKVGDVDFAWLSSGDLARHIPEFNIFGVSYLIKDNDHYAKAAAMDSEMMRLLDEIVTDADIGSRLVGMMGGSPRRLFNSERSVNTPEDLKGLSIRIQDSPVEAQVWSKLGAKPVPLAWDELYTGLQSGVVDGAEASTSAYDTNKFYEVAPYHSLTEHQYMFLPVLMSNQTYEKLPDELRDIVLAVMEEAAVMSWEIYWEEDERLEKELAEKGVTIDQVDTAPFMDIVAPIADEVAKENNAESILEFIRKAGE